MGGAYGDHLHPCSPMETTCTLVPQVVTEPCLPAVFLKEALVPSRGETSAGEAGAAGDDPPSLEVQVVKLAASLVEKYDQRAQVQLVKQRLEIIAGRWVGGFRKPAVMALKISSLRRC